MADRDYRDILTGLVIAAFGLFVAGYSFMWLDIGSATQMGPGMFPAGLGMLLAILGLFILIPALLRPGTMPGLDLRSGLTILAAIAAFALLLDYLGLIAAIFGLTLIAATANSKIGLVTALVLAAFLCAGVILIFRIGLGMSLPLYTWAS